MRDNDEIQNRYLKICEMTSEEEIEVMSDGDSNVRDYEVGDCVQIKGGGNGRIVKILYLLLDEENDVNCCRKTDLGSHTTFDKF